MSSLFRREPKRRKKRGYWHVFFYNPETQKQKSHTLGTKYADVAERRYIEIVRAYEAGDFDPFTEKYEYRLLTFEKAVERFNNENAQRVREGDLSQVTKDDYEAFLAILTRKVSPDRLLKDIDERFLRRFIFNSGLSPHTQRGYYTRLNRFFRWTVEAKLISTSPLDGLKRPNPGKKKPVFMKREEIETMLTAIEKDYRVKVAKLQIENHKLLWNTDAIRLAVGTGLRQAELVRLRWIDVDIKNGMLYIRTNIETAKGRRRTKNRQERTVPIFPDVREVLERLNGARTNENDSKTVLAGPNGEPRYGPNLTKTFRTYRDKNNLSKAYNWHTLRHTFGSWLRIDGVPLDRIKEWMGHATLEQTLVYAHIVPETIAKEGEKTFPVFFSGEPQNKEAKN